MQRTLFDAPSADPCQRKHGGNAESVAAFERLGPSLREVQGCVFQAIADAGSAGLTMKELARRWGVQLNTISGRASELKIMGLVRGNGLRRDGAAVLVLARKNQEVQTC